MQTQLPRRALLTVAATSALVSGCGAGQASTPEAVPTAEPTTELSRKPAEPEDCATNLDAVVGLLRSGQPEHMFERATNLDELVSRADLVLVGTIESFVRAEPSAGTSIAVSGTTVIAGVSPAALPVTSFWADSTWADGLGPDPLATSSSGHGATFIAFLEQFDAAPGGLVVGGQGLYIDCGDPSDSARQAVSESLPADSQGMSVQEMAFAIRAR